MVFGMNQPKKLAGMGLFVSIALIVFTPTDHVENTNLIEVIAVVKYRMQLKQCQIARDVLIVSDCCNRCN